ncbi:MAG: tetratricopeptide repeat protein [Bacteroidetes bacterium]|nr:tetratricopeptide repeat protein [Bacteroidota bacterium]
MKTKTLLFLLLITVLTGNSQSLPDLIKNGYEKLAASNFQGAEKDFAAAIHVNDPVIMAYLTKLKKINSMNDYQRSISDTPDGFVYNHDFALPYYGHGLALEGLSKQEEALTDYEKAISIDPKYSDAICQQGIILIAKGGKDKGCISLMEAKKLGNEKAKGLYEQNACSGMNASFLVSGNAKYAAKDYEAALTDFTYAIQLNSDSFEAFLKRAQCNVSLKKYDKAINDYNQTLKIKPDTINILYLRGIAYLTAEQFKEAFDDFTEVIKLSPNQYDAYMRRGDACEGLTNSKSAIYDFSEAIRIKPKDGNAYYRRGLAKQDTKDASACKDFKTAVTLGIEDAKGQAEGCQ